MQVAYIDREDKVRDNDDVKLQSTKYEATSAIGRDRRRINVSLYIRVECRGRGGCLDRVRVAGEWRWLIDRTTINNTSTYVLTAQQL